MFSDSLWLILVIGGPIVLAAVLIWARVRNKQTPREEAHTEQATRDMYRDQDREDAEGR